MYVATCHMTRTQNGDMSAVKNISLNSNLGNLHFLQKCKAGVK